MDQKRTLIAVGAVVAFVGSAAAFTSNLEKLGLDGLLPASRAHVHRIAQVLQQQQLQDAEYWIDLFQRRQTELEFERRRYMDEHPSEPVPRVFDDQKRGLDLRIKKLQNQQMFKPPAQ